MTNNNKMYKSCAKLMADDVRLGIHFMGMAAFEETLARAYNLNGSIEIRSSVEHDKFDLYATGADVFGIAAQKKGGLFAEVKNGDVTIRTLCFLEEIKTQNPDYFSYRLNSVKDPEIKALLREASLAPQEEASDGKSFTYGDALTNGFFSRHKQANNGKSVSLVM